MTRPDLPASHPANVPLNKWTDGWLKLECASLSGNVEFIWMHDHEKRAHNLPVTRDEMVAYIETRR